MPTTQGRKTRGPYISPTGDQEITVDHIVAENLIQLRKDRSWLSRPAFIEGIKEFGVHLSEHQMWKIEKGERSLKSSELMGIALYFDVPVTYFFWPPGVYLNREVRQGDLVVPAHELLLDLLYPRNEDHDPYNRALIVATEAASEYGNVSAVRKLKEASRKRNA